MHFDNSGLLKPAELARTDLEIIYNQFVAQLPASQTRATLYHEWTKYNHLLRQQTGVDFEQWIDGSFVSMKLNPKDIDIVSFIPQHLYLRHETILNKFWSDTCEMEGIDAYLVKLYPADHPSYLERTAPE